MPNTPLDFQSMVFALQTFWSGQGCLISEPYYSQVGAGTMNPATYLRVLGPEPWKVGYVERMMAAMVSIPTACSSIINFKSSSSPTRATRRSFT